jgi:hypothetical protein
MLKVSVAIEILSFSTPLGRKLELVLKLWHALAELASEFISFVSDWSSCSTWLHRFSWSARERSHPRPNLTNYTS